jgi:hypothetical protein
VINKAVETIRTGMSGKKKQQGTIKDPQTI